MLTGIVTRTRAYKDADLLVDFITGPQGRLSAIARGARKSKRRFAGALEIGAHLELNLQRRKSSGLYTLTGCDIISVPRRARLELGRFYQLAYVLELATALCQEGAPAEGNVRAVVAYLNDLERMTPSHGALLHWELSRMEENGFGLRFIPCQVTGAEPNALSVSHGGAINTVEVRTTDAYPLSIDALSLLDGVQRGRESLLPLHVHGEARRAVDYAWRQILERELKSAAFLGPDSFAAPQKTEAE